MRYKIYDIIESGKTYPELNHLYSGFMLICIVLSLVPLAFRGSTPFFNFLDKATVAVFIVDYIFRLITADIKYDRQGIIPFIRYPFSLMAIIDILSILPSLSLTNVAFKTFRVTRFVILSRALRTTKALSALKSFRFTKSASILGRVLYDSKEGLILMSMSVVAYIMTTSLIMFNVEPQTFNTYFDALYWATMTLTTVGYGDIYAVSRIGKMITMVSSLVGVAVIALPSGILTAGFVREMNKDNNKK